MTIATFETLNERDLGYLDEAEAAHGVTVEQRDAPRGDERALLVEHRDLSLAEIDAMRQLQVVYLLEWGRATVPLNRLEARGVSIRRVLNLSGLGVAEHTLALMLALKKQIVTGHRDVVNNVWREGVDEPLYTDQRAHTFNWSGVENIGWLYDQTLGIIGFGRIGKAVARRAQAFDMRVIYYNRHRLAASEERRLGVEYAEVDDLVARADVITLHLPFSETTEHIVGAEQFARMKPSAILINAARGRVVDEEALTAALQERRIAGAGLDVLVFEPPQRDNPILTLDNVVFSPHVAGTYDPIARREQFQTALRWWAAESR